MMGPFTTKVAQKQNSWLLNNAGQEISINNLHGIIRDAFDLSFTQGNIRAGFKETGVWPLDTTVFTDEDFEKFGHDRQTNNKQQSSSLMVESTAASPTAGLAMMLKPQPLH